MKPDKPIKSDTVESLDKSRYFAVKWLTISSALFIGPLTAHYLIDSMDADRIYKIINVPISLIGGILFQVFVFRFVKLMKRINSNPEYRQILNDEYYISTTSKSLRNGYGAFVIVMGISIGVTALFPSIPAIVVCLIIALVVFLCTQISWLVYNR